jgi:hypothetical protein
MDDCGVAKDSNFDIVSRQIRHMGRPCGLLEECGPVYDRPIRIRAAEITIKQNFVKMFDVGMQDRVDVFPIEPLEQKLRRQVGAVLRLIWQGFLLGAELAISQRHGSEAVSCSRYYIPMVGLSKGRSVGRQN